MELRCVHCQRIDGHLWDGPIPCCELVDDQDNQGDPLISTGTQMKLDVSYREGQWPVWSVNGLKGREALWLVHWRLRSANRHRRYTQLRLSSE